MNDSEHGGEVKENVQNTETWKRGLYILLYAVIGHLVVGVIWLVVIFQFFAKLITGDLNANLKEFSVSLTRYAVQILEYVTFQSDERPWPFGNPLE